ncbi:DUF421 domain-containing protein [Actinoalloteichus caeruleus]|uniref:YetF C-terminal domain-containing protein n=1 Tax=Actinoalloteichus caeruleus DSM 43889 TaxID=1120930 RepID=A0ABT1JP25_ACTCY|nr:YetF domain-containing protein [Actinoalloteichus caeruleus]MCP2334287.1 Protein of unknown function (DUF421) [Actinoalloteichus caeruleus DSM 43889]
MHSVLATTAVYLGILVLLRLTGKRTLAQVSTLDLILLLIISEATQQALIGDDFSITTALLVITTLMFVDRTADYLRWRFRPVDRVLQGAPLVLVDHGKPVDRHLAAQHITVDDILTAARERQGVHGLHQIRYAVLETSGAISIIPTPEAASGPAGRGRCD